MLVVLVTCAGNVNCRFHASCQLRFVIKSCECIVINKNGRSAEFVATIQRQQEGDHRTRRPNNIRRVFLAEECEDQLFGVGVCKRLRSLQHTGVTYGALPACFAVLVKKEPQRSIIR